MVTPFSDLDKAKKVTVEHEPLISFLCAVRQAVQIENGYPLDPTTGQCVGDAVGEGHG